MGVTCEVTQAFDKKERRSQDMVDTNRLKSVIVLNGMTQKDVAEHLQMSSKTFGLRMKKGVFGSDEIEKMVEFLKIDDPAPIFFAKEVT